MPEGGARARRGAESRSRELWNCFVFRGPNGCDLRAKNAYESSLSIFIINLYSQFIVLSTFKFNRTTLHFDFYENDS